MKLSNYPIHSKEKELINMKIGLIDPALFTTSTRSPNIGDQIISRAVHRELCSIFGSATEIVAVPSHQYPSRSSLKLLEDADHIFVGGSNLLWFRWWGPSSWKIGPMGAMYYRNLILLGVGWGAYEIKPNVYGRWLCDLLLSSDYSHSVRDSFTQNILKNDLNTPNVANTACPTMWCLAGMNSEKLSSQKGEECIFSLTDYSKVPEHDGQLIRDLTKIYEGNLLFWPQGDGDLEYCRSLGYTGRVIERSLTSLLSILSSGVQYDYVGTRLHAGILCLEHGVRTLIVSIDNRAQEIAADTGLPVVTRGDRMRMHEWLSGEQKMQFKLPIEDIRNWKEQFSVSRSSPTSI